MAGQSEDEQGREPIDDLGEAWRWGVDASRRMSERLLDLYGQVGAATLDGLARNGTDDLRQVRKDMDRWVDLSVALFDRAFAVMRTMAGEGNGAGAGAPERISLCGAPGDTCTGELWVHNVAGGERRAPVVLCSALTSATGGEIPASQVRIDAGRGPLDGGTSRRMTVAVDVPPGAAGVYHGHIVSDASPDGVILLRLDVARD